MTKLAIRLSMLVLFAVALEAAPMIAPANAATDESTAVKKKHKKTSPAGTQTPTTSTQYPPNMSDDPNRRVGY